VTKVVYLTSFFVKTSIMSDLDDDVIPAIAEEPMYPPWFQRPAPSPVFTLVVAVITLAFAAWFYAARVKTLKNKFEENFTGSLRVCALISAYMDNYGFPRFATLRLCTKSFFFLALLQMNFHKGFWIMWIFLILESSLDTIRVLLAYRNCGSINKITALSDEEAHDMRSTTTLSPTNVYEDLTRPKSIAIMVFLVQGMLIGLVMDDTYQQTTRTCFNGHDGCPMLTSLGSYCLYLIGTFMACVFFIGPRNAYGQKEQNPTFWLKLFLMSKERASVLSWKDSVTEQTHSFVLRRNDWRIWLRFLLSFLVNGVGFHVLVHLLPIQVAGQSTIIGVVFRAIGMIYLADLDDSDGFQMTLVSSDGSNTGDLANGSSNYGSNGTSQISAAELDAAKQQILNDAVADVTQKLQALVGGTQPRRNKVTNITNALFLSAVRGKRKKNDDATADEKTSLVAV
jgi:hypothetical protein